jgi:hypothetical protein
LNPEYVWPSHPRSAAAFTEFLALLEAQGATLLEEGWLGGRTSHRIRCAKGHETTIHPQSMRYGATVCKVCTGRDPQTAFARFRAIVAEHGGVVLDAEWSGNSERLRVRCPEGHVNLLMPITVTQGGGICKTCSRCDPAVAEAEFRAALAERGATLLEPRYLGGTKPHKIRCPEGHIVTQTPNNVRKGRGCRICSGRYWGKGAEEFVTRLTEMGAELLEPEWLGGGEPHRAICAQGHACFARPNVVKRGGGICKICAGQDKATAEAEFRARLAALGMTLLEPEYLGANRPHRAICAAGHECSPYPTCLQRGDGGCPSCAHQAWDIFYVVVNQEERRVKFGITSLDPRTRLTRHRSNGYRQVELLLENLPGSMANDIERAVNADLRATGIRPVKGREYYDLRHLPTILHVAVNYAIPSGQGVLFDISEVRAA